MKPEREPVREGDVCWDVAYAERMLSPVSQVGSHATDWFLATHSPITCSDRIGPVEERKLFGDLFASVKHETLVAYNSPSRPPTRGTGAPISGW